MTVAAKIRSLDVTATQLDGNGIADFVWPLSWRDHAQFRDNLLSGYAAVIRAGFARGDEDSDLLAILAMEFIQEAMRGWFVATLLSRFAQRGETITAPWLRGGASDDPATWQAQRDRLSFLRGRFPSSGWRSLLRPAYGLLQGSELSWRWPQTVDFRSRIIATNPCKLTCRRAGHEQEKPVLVSLRHWFGDACDSLPTDLSPLALRPETVDAVMTVIADAAIASGEQAPNAQLAHLRSWLIEASATTRWYLRWLNNHPRRLPARLWTGSGGYIFRRILHMAVRRNGGTCWSHDHGSGVGLFDICDTNLTEFVTPDTFVTFSSIQAQGYQTQRHEAFRMAPSWPTIEAAPKPAGEPQRQVPAATVGMGKTILFLANQYRGEKVSLTPIEFDFVAADWQARLFSRLRALGYEVLMRAHPESPSLPPGGIGAPLAGGPFSEALARADMVIMDYLHTTVLKDILFSGKPVLTFEFGHCPPNAVAADALARRIRFIPGWYDEDNRAHTDWSALSSAIDDARGMAADQAFVSLFEV
ncbi:MAG: hypothetical protein H7Y60_01920 [Rhodospirillaceae bacterium]|nr:hypothetical protein [Rhodospirillales bacterium]